MHLKLLAQIHGLSVLPHLFSISGSFHSEYKGISEVWFASAVVPNLGPPDVLGLQLPEAFTTTSDGQDFWKLNSKNIWRPKVGGHYASELKQSSPAKTFMTFLYQRKGRPQPPQPLSARMASLNLLPHHLLSSFPACLSH